MFGGVGLNFCLFDKSVVLFLGVTDKLPLIVTHVSLFVLRFVLMFCATTYYYDVRVALLL